jgi:hypothetical protein
MVGYIEFNFSKLVLVPNAATLPANFELISYWVKVSGKFFSRLKVLKNLGIRFY